jgi:hypothetical protein
MTDVDLATRLRRAVASADPGWAVQPSRLRRALVDELGPDGHRFRSQLHQLVVAADENIPVRLRRTGWSPEVRDELAAALMAARGWTEAAAAWTVTTWAAALDLIDPAAAREATATVEPTTTDTVTDLGKTDVGKTDIGKTDVGKTDLGETDHDPATNLAPDVAGSTSSATDSATDTAFGDPS